MSFILKNLFRVRFVEGQFLIRCLERWSVEFFVCCTVSISVPLLFSPKAFFFVIPFTILACLCYFYAARRVFCAMRRVTDNGRGPVICSQLRPLAFRTLSFGVRRVLMWGVSVICLLTIVVIIGPIMMSWMESLFGDVRNPIFYLMAAFCILVLVGFMVVSVLGVRALTEWTGIVTRSRAVACELKEMGIQPSYFVPEQSKDQAPLWKMVCAWVLLMMFFLWPGLEISLFGVLLALFPLVLVSSRLLGDGRGAGSRLRIPRWVLLAFLIYFAGWAFCDVASLSAYKADCVSVFCTLIDIFCLVLAVFTGEICYAVMGEPDAADRQQTKQPDKEVEDVIVGNIRQSLGAGLWRSLRPALRMDRRVPLAAARQHCDNLHPTRVIPDFHLSV